MSRRTWYRVGLLGSGAIWLVLECVAAWDGDRTTEPLTELAVSFVPWWVTVPVVVALAAWLPPHFLSAYSRRRTLNGPGDRS